jgi:hypothetical protein
MFLEPDDAPAVRRTIDAALDAGATVWTNRMPLPFLEGVERLAQDPGKMEDELRGRRALLERLVSTGRPLLCRETRRCARCPIDSYCARLHEAVGRARAGARTSTLRLDPADRRQVRALQRAPYRATRRLWLRTERAPRAWDPAAFRAVERAGAVRLAAPDSVLLAALRDLPAHTTLQLQPRDGIGIPGDLAAAGRELVVPLSASLLRTVPPSTGRGAGGLLLAFPGAEAGERLGWPFGTDARPAGGWLRAAAAVEGIPPCLAGGRALRETPDVFDLGWLDEAGRIDPFAVLRTFVDEGSRTWSFRCRSCAARRGCPGLPWAMARRVGLAVLRPPCRRPRRVP